VGILLTCACQSSAWFLILPLTALCRTRTCVRTPRNVPLTLSPTVLQAMPRKWKPTFYAYQTSDSLFISWPDSIATEHNRKKEAIEARKKDDSGTDNPFTRLHRKKCGDRIFKALSRFSEQQHFEIIKQRANLRYQVPYVYCVHTYMCTYMYYLDVRKCMHEYVRTYVHV